jgi:hypothetical protein
MQYHSRKRRLAIHARGVRNRERTLFIGQWLLLRHEPTEYVHPRPRVVLADLTDAALGAILGIHGLYLVVTAEPVPEPRVQNGP